MFYLAYFAEGEYKKMLVFQAHQKVVSVITVIMLISVVTVDNRHSSSTHVTRQWGSPVLEVFAEGPSLIPNMGTL